MIEDLRRYIEAEIAELERQRQGLVDAAQAQINLLSLLIEQRKATLKAPTNASAPPETRAGAPG